MRLEMLFICFCLCMFSGSVLADMEVVEPSPCSSSPLNTTDSLDVFLAQWAQMSGIMELQLASGEHCIRNFSLVRDLVDKSIVGNGSVTIKCAAGLGLAFYNMTRLTFTNITIDGCGLEFDFINKFLSTVMTDIDFFLNLANNSHPQYIAMAVGNCQDFEMRNTSIVNTNGLGLLAVNLVGQSHLISVRFEHNVPIGCFVGRSPSEFYDSERIGGGALFVYLDYTSSSGEILPSLDIRSSSFNKNSYCGYSSWYLINSAYYSEGKIKPLLGGGAGLTLIFSQLQYKVSVTTYNSMFINNTGFYGGGAYVAFYTGVFDSVVRFLGCEFVSNGVEASVDSDPIVYPVVGSAMSLYMDFVQPQFQLSNITQLSASAVYVVNCSFVANTAFTGILAIHSFYNLIIPEFGRSEVQIQLERCVFQENQAVVGPVLYATEYKTSKLQRGISISLLDVQIFHNTVLSQSTITSPSELSGVIHIKEIKFKLSGTSSLQHNSGSALKASSSIIILQGDISFHNNTAGYGGGMSLVGDTVVVVDENTTVSFTSNTGAVKGGAIYVEFVALPTNFLYQDCFLYFSGGLLCGAFGGDYCGDITKMGVTIRFEGNTALLGGMIYGSTLQTCPWSDNFMHKYAPGIHFDDKRLFVVLYEEDNFTSPFQFDRLPGDATAMSTPVLKLTATAVDPMLNSSISHLNVAPGIDQRIELAAKDAFGQLIPAVVSSRSSTEGTLSVLGSGYVFVNYDSKEITSLSITSTAANPEGDIAEVSLFTVGILSQFLVNVSFTVCPGGFYFNSTYNTCTCLEDLGRFKVTCTPDGGLIVPVNTWLGVDEGSALVVACSFDFCSRLVTNINADIDEVPFSGQCRDGYNRSGPGCGGCAANYSAVFGSNHCLRCSNSYVLLLLVFAALGILLMAVMLLLRISIAGGFLNGVLFFSNIVSLYAPLYAPTFYSSFILFSWFSLKFGIPSCFFDGMRPLDIAVLNFVFPLYLYALVFVIVILTRRSAKFAEWLFRTKSSPTKLFATILVMTYSSLLESCLQAISFTRLNVVSPNGTLSEYRWLLDPSHKYFHGAHGALGVFAVLLLVFFIIPAPILWMFPSKIFSIKVLRRYKPIYDAIWAPFKPRYRFWVSLRLFLRVPPILFVGFIPVPENLLLLSIFLVITSYIYGTAHPFQGTAQNIFDGLLQILLLIMTISSLYFVILLQYARLPDNIKLANDVVENIYHTQQITVTLLLSIAYATCFLTFIWHLLTSFPQLRKRAGFAWNRVVVCKIFHVHVPGESAGPRDSTAIVHPEDLPNYGSIETEKTEPSTPKTVATFSELREPLLEDTSGLMDLNSINN